MLCFSLEDTNSHILHLVREGSGNVLPYQWRSGSVLKTGRREEPGSFPGHAGRPNRSEFFALFSETRVNTN